MLSVIEKPLVRMAVYGLVGTLAFMIAGVLAFPDEEIKAIITVQLEKQLGAKYEVGIVDLDLWWLTGVSLSGVSISERVNPNAPEPDPDVPADLPVKINIAEVNARIAILSSIINGPTVEFEADVGGGVIEGSFSMGADERRLQVEFDELDLRKTTSVTALTGVPFFGTMSGEIDVVLDPKKAIATGGTVKIEGEQLTLGPATVMTDKFPPMTYFEIPQTNFGKMLIELEIQKKGSATPKMTAKSFQSSGRDIRMELWGHMELAAHVKRSRSNTSMRMQLDEGFVKKNSLGPLLNVNEVRKGKLKDWYGFTFTGSVSKIRFKGSTAAAKGAPATPAPGDPAADPKAEKTPPSKAKTPKSPAKPAAKKAKAKPKPKKEAPEPAEPEEE